MQIIDDLARANLRQETVLTIGAFDGVHRGHQSLIRAVVERARNTDRLAALITFHPHPVMVLAPERAPRFLTTPGEKLALLEKLGVDVVVLLPFDLEMAAMPARTFMERVVRYLRLRELWVGARFALGRNREGDVAHLRELGHELGYDTTIFEVVEAGGQAISSSRIRSLLREGRIAEAAALLGRYPSIAGEVMRGAPREPVPGFRIASLEVRSERAMPADGVYAVFAVLGSERYPAVASISSSLGLGGGHIRVEAHILDFAEDIHGCDLVVEFVSRLRDERGYDDVDDLVTQIAIDTEDARSVLSRTREQAGRNGLTLRECRFRYREREHTADRLLHVWGAGLPDLLVGAARGMCSLMGDLERLAPEHWRTIRLEASDREALLVEWLNELLFLNETEGLLFVDFSIESVDDAALTEDGTVGAKLVAHAGGAVAPVTRAHIKAATFHDLRLVEERGGWSTLITFDV